MGMARLASACCVMMNAFQRSVPSGDVGRTTTFMPKGLVRTTGSALPGGNGDAQDGSQLK
jgi:hypothetical protein